MANDARPPLQCRVCPTIEGRFRFTAGVIYNSLIRNSAVAFGVNTLEKEETDNGSLIIGREESNMEIFDTRIVSELSLVGGSVR